MESQTQKILTELEALTNCLIYPLTGDAPYTTFCWLLKEKGEFTLEKFLFDIKAIKISNIHEIFKNVRKYSSNLILENYTTLIKILEQNLAILHVYYYFDIPIIFGYTSSGELIGLAPEQVYSNKKELEPILIYPEQTQASQTTSVLVREIKTVIDKLPYEFINGAFPERLFWAVKALSNRKYIVQEMMIDTRLIRNEDMDDFFRMENGEEDLPLLNLLNPPKKNRQRELRVREIFKSVLVNSNVYWIHPPYADYVTAYVLGQTPELDYVGVKIYGWAH